MKKKTILFLDHTARMGGGEIALLRLATALDRQRFTPVVALGMEGSLASALEKAGIETHITPLAQHVLEMRKETLGLRCIFRLGLFFQLLASVWNLARFLKKRRVDIVHTNSLKADVIGGLAARFCGVPLIWHVRDRIAPDYLPAAAMHGFRLLCRLLPDHIIANSTATLRTLGNNPRDNRSVIHDGVPSSYRPSSISQQSQPLLELPC